MVNFWGAPRPCGVKENSILGEYFSQTAYLAIELFGHDSDWLRALEELTPAPATKAASAGKS